MKRRIWEKLIDGADVFMLVNGAIVFGDGPVRWYGAILVVMLIGRWIYSFRKARID